MRQEKLRPFSSADIYIYIYIYIYASCNSMASIPIQLKQWKINFSQPIKIWIMHTIIPDSLYGYNINIFKGIFRDFNLHNRLHICKICSSDVNKSPTCFRTSLVPLSDSPLSIHHTTLKMVRCKVGSKNTAKYLHTHNVCLCVCKCFAEGVMKATEMTP